MYPTDLTDDQWKLIELLLPKRKPNSRGRPRKWSYRTIINAISYLVKTGCPWRMLPKEFPPWDLAYYYFKAWKHSGLWFEIHETLRVAVRESIGKTADPSAAIIDSQSVKTVQKGGAGF